MGGRNSTRLDFIMRLPKDGMPTERFGTSISCMDGRIQTVLSDWIKENYAVDHVDTITAPGVDRRVAEGDNLGPLVHMARISVRKHGSRLIVISGHYDCAGNPVSDEEHAAHIRSGVEAIKSWDKEYGLVEEAATGGGRGITRTQGIEVVGVWVGRSLKKVQRIA